MNRRTFFSLTAAVALTVGVVAFALPGAVLASKGVAPSPAAEVWVREVGALLVAIGATVASLRDAPDSATLRAFCAGNALVHVGLLPVEVWAYAQGVIPRVASIAPNSALHLFLAVGFARHAWLMKDSTGWSPEGRRVAPDRAA